MTAVDEGALDPVAVLAALGVAGATVIGPVGGGRDTAIWRVEIGSQAGALRVFRPEQAAGCVREGAAMRAASAAGLPVPAVLAEGAWRDRPAMLLTWLPGRTLADALATWPWRVSALGAACGAMQARIHAVAAPAALGSAPESWLGWFGPHEPVLRDRLRALAAPSPSLLHLDYHPLNVLTDGRQITGVLDWTNARAGDPRADLARSEAILRLEPVATGPLGAIEMLLRRALLAGWWRGYRQIAGPPADLAAFYAWAGRVMLRDRGPRPDRPDHSGSLSPRDLDRIRRWAADWQRRADRPE